MFTDDPDPWSELAAPDFSDVQEPKKRPTPATDALQFATGRVFQGPTSNSQAAVYSWLDELVAQLESDLKSVGVKAVKPLYLDRTNPLVGITQVNAFLQQYGKGKLSRDRFIAYTKALKTTQGHIVMEPNTNFEVDLSDDSLRREISPSLAEYNPKSSDLDTAADAMMLALADFQDSGATLPEGYEAQELAPAAEIEVSEYAANTEIIEVPTPGTPASPTGETGLWDRAKARWDGLPDWAKWLVKGAAGGAALAAILRRS